MKKQFPALLPAQVREQMLLSKQACLVTSLSSYNVVTNIISRPKQKLSKELDEDLLFRFGYVPFVIAEVAYDYVDSVIDMACLLRISETKRLCRAIKELRKEYNSFRRSVYYGAEQHEEDNMLVFQNELKEDFSAMYVDSCNALLDKYPDLNSEYKIMLAAVYMARIVFSALFRYVSDMNRIVEAQVGHPIGNILPSHLRKINELVIHFVGDKSLGNEFNKTMARHVANLVKYIHDIKLDKHE